MRWISRGIGMRKVGGVSHGGWACYGGNGKDAAQRCMQPYRRLRGWDRASIRWGAKICLQNDRVLVAWVMAPRGQQRQPGPLLR